MPINGKTKVTLDLTLDEVNVLIGALATQPYSTVNDLIGHIKGSTLQQVAEMEKAEQGTGDS